MLQVNIANFWELITLCGHKRKWLTLPHRIRFRHFKITKILLSPKSLRVAQAPQNQQSIPRYHMYDILALLNQDRIAQWLEHPPSLGRSLVQTQVWSPLFLRSHDLSVILTPSFPCAGPCVDRHRPGSQKCEGVRHLVCDHAMPAEVSYHEGQW